MLRFGVDLGGTKTELVAFDALGQVVLRRREPTPRDLKGICHTIAQLVSNAEALLGDTGTVGVATPGSVSPTTGKMRNSNTAALNGANLVETLSVQLGRTVRIANDANCFALSEACDGPLQATIRSLA